VWSSRQFLHISQDMVCVANLQHDCAAEGMCTLQHVAEHQERENTGPMQHVVQHLNSQQYRLNTQGLHGIKHICCALPPSLLEGQQLNVDRRMLICNAIQRLASATVSKTLHAEAQKAAKESYGSIV
jgi:hypothetical protein